MSDTNPIAFAHELKAVLERYIATTLPVSRRYPKLGQTFRELLAQQQLVQGPFVEALPDFEKGKPLAQLLQSAGGFLHDGLAKLPTANRPLHLHQELALRHAILDKESFLTATGTGSGKTETFLYPIAHALLSDPEPQKPGVRALLVYPMNALANDQLNYRIAPLFGNYLREYNITFGRYTGQVKSTAKREEEEARIWENEQLISALGNPRALPRNWHLTRDEMLADPPKILITNYAMLEHLLLLPRNAALFATNALRFIVLDEIHTYRGAQATEVAFLLRKLKTRLKADSGIQVFGTSASLSDSPTADDELKAFASGLFGEPVQRVIRGRRITHTALTQPVSASFSMSITQWVSLGNMLREFLQLHREDQTIDCWNRLIDADEDLPQRLKLATAGTSTSGWNEALVGTFSCNDEVRRVAAVLEAGRVVAYPHLAQQTFANYEDDPSAAQQALNTVIQCGMLARRQSGDYPLLPGRYHIAVNSIEGLVVQPSADGEGWTKVRVGRSYRDDHGHYYPLMTCRKCGQPFLEGWRTSSHVHPNRPDSGEASAERIVFWLGAPYQGTQDEDDELEAETSSIDSQQRIFVRLNTGEISPAEDSVPLYPVRTEQDDVEQVHYVKRCPACGGRSTGADAEVVTKMHPGNEALGAVVAQRVLEALPPGLIDNAYPRPAFGRNLLTFSDNRQDAAFFAPYFERTAANLALRSAVRAVLADTSSAMTIAQLAERTYDIWRKDGGQPLLLDASGEPRTDKTDVVPLLLGALGYEFCTPGGRRNSLETLGVALVSYDDAKLRSLCQHVKSFLPPPLTGDAGAAETVCHVLLESVRRERALERLAGLSMNDQHTWGDYNQHRSFDIESGDPNVTFKWLPAKQGNRHNRRSWYLVEQLGWTREQAEDFLKRFWEAITHPPTTFLKRHPPGFALDGDLIRITSGLTKPLYQCMSCGLFQRHVLANKCSAFGCRGSTVRLSEEERSRLHRENHYLASYQESNHVTLVAHEHTASLSTELREDIERRFAARYINLLSCTTTMEMGVDLGDLEAVVNLNVPPGIANYQQRTGRAGRRAQAAPFCVTVARNTNYDQAVFKSLRDYLASSPDTPFINLANEELFQRHQLSIVLSYFLRQTLARHDINAPSLKHLFGDILDDAAKLAFYDRLHAWLESEQGLAALKEAESLGDMVDTDLSSLVLRGPHLKWVVINRLKEFAEDVAERCSAYLRKTTDAKAIDDLKTALRWKTHLERYMDQLLVNELSRRGLIPTYSFPVHSLTLEVQNGATFNRYQNQPDVSLSRDASLGISEYAPGAEVVANGRIWESAGLAHYPKAFMPERWYAACPECFHVDVADTHQDLASNCSNCGFSDATRRKRKFLEPKGFITSAEEPKGRDPGSTRRRVKPADEARLIASPQSSDFEETDVPFLRSALLLARGNETRGNDERPPLRGSLFVANRGTYGEGYYRCLTCNFCMPLDRRSSSKVNKKKGAAKTSPGDAKFVHRDPSTGAPCKSNTPLKAGLDFAHTFNTDIRLIRFVAALPAAPDDISDKRQFEEQIGRTIAEACRIAASKMLRLQAGELRSTYRLYATAGNVVEVVLYDGVPGGAGYSARLGSPQYSMSSLIAATIRVLDCVENCESACRACLCDYGNQRYWDNFRRRDALAWLQNLAEGEPSQGSVGGYVPWSKPSLAGLAERLASSPTVSVIAPSLCGVNSYRDDELRQLLTWLQEGKAVNLYLLNRLDPHPRDFRTLMLYRHLYPWVHQGKLKVFDAGSSAHDSLGLAPRIFTGLETGSFMARQRFAVQGALDGLIAAPAELGAMDNDTRELLSALIDKAKAYEADRFTEGPKMQLWELSVGQKRPLDQIFSVLHDTYIKSAVIKDPYCGTSRNRRRLRELLEYLKSKVTAIDRVDVYCAETKERQPDGTEYVEHRYDVSRHLEDILKAIDVKHSDVQVKELGRTRAFHDRELRFEVTDSAGCDTEHRFFLTGGIDYLLDERSDTKVFHAVNTK